MVTTKASRGEARNFRPGSNPDHKETIPMAKATRVHSTPRRTASKIKPCQKAAHSCGHSYRSIEGTMTECLLMADVAAIVAHDTLSDSEPRISADQAGAVTFAVYQLTNAVRELHAQYFSAFEKAVRS
jgi:hypothetical protein